MSTNLKLLNQNNKKIYGGGNVKQGLVPSGTKFYGMRLKTNLNRARNGSGNACKAYDGVCFEQFDRSTVCFGTSIGSVTGGTETTKGGYRYHTFSVAGTYSLEYSLIGVCVAPGTPIKIDYMIVGGGGGGSGQLANAATGGYSGGGGGGGVQTGTDTIIAGTYNIQVGKFGPAGIGLTQGNAAAPNGVSSTFNGHTSQGGDGGIMVIPDAAFPNKGSRGGSSGTPTANVAGVITGGVIGAGSGGGGAGGASEDVTVNSTGGDGGAEFATDATWNPIVGSAVVPAFGYGGGGGARITAGATGATGGGSDGGVNSAGLVATPWSAGLFAGGGGGGAAANISGTTANGGAGADGIVIIRYPV
jgi:hypothetical protein